MRLRSDPTNETSRSLPLAFGADGIEGTADDSAVAPGDWTETMAYDDQNRQTLAVSFEGAVTQYLYDARTGNLSEKRLFDNLTDYNDGQGTPTETINYTYDAFGRQVEVTDSGATGSASVFTSYDAQGNLIRTASDQGVVTYAYDNLGRMTKMMVGEADAPTAETDYAYDALGRLATVNVIKRDGATLDNDPNTAGNQPETTNYQYDLVGNLRRTDLPNGVITTYTYDGLSRLTQQLVYQPDSTPNDPSDNPKLEEFDYTLRPDGLKQTESDTTWVDVSGQTAEVDDHYAWSYDALDRLTDEVFTTNADSILGVDPNLPSYSRPLQSYHDQYFFDLASNRIEKTTDLGNDGSIDETITDTVDANDRLLEEVDTNTSGSTATEYSYSHTQETGETIYSGTPSALGPIQSDQTFEFDLQGRMSATTLTTYANGVASQVQRTTYAYDDNGIRVSALTATDGEADGIYETHVLTQYLNDSNNATGYAQVIRQTTSDPATGQVQSVADYTIGQDRVSQTTTPYTNSVPGAPTTLYFSYDGHDSTRALLTAGAAIATLTGIPQIFTYDVYGNAIGFDPTAVGTTFLYNGEPFDAHALMQYLRDRYYSAQTGRFNTLDPSSGNPQDPLSLHKYLYGTADPPNTSDPSGDSALFYLLTQFQAVGDTGATVINPSITGHRFNEYWLRLYIELAARRLKYAHYPNAANPTFTYGYGERMTEAQVRSVFRPASGNPGIECYGMANIVMARGLIEALGRGNFDKLYNTSTMPIPVFGKGITMPIENAKEGDWLYFANDRDYLTKHRNGDFQGENVIKVGPDQYWGWAGEETGVGIIKTYEGWKTELVDAYNDPGANTTKINTVPGYTGQVRFFRMTQVYADFNRVIMGGL